MTNEDIINCEDKTSMPEDLFDWMTHNYTKLNEGETVPGAKWEMVCRKGNDWKYGRLKICTEKMVWRGLTFSEFYGGGIVD